MQKAPDLASGGSGYGDMRKNSLYSRMCLASVFGAVMGLSAPNAGSFPGFVNPQDEIEEFDEVQDFGGWAVILLDEVLNVPNRAARDHLLRAGFATGPRILPQLEKALEDDRTAEFAAQLLAFMGNNRALRTLQKLVDDPRDLGLKRFFYGALGEFNTPRTRQTLLDVVGRADDEPDPIVTEMAILALTVLADPSLIPLLGEVRAGPSTLSFETILRMPSKSSDSERTTWKRCGPKQRVM